MTIIRGRCVNYSLSRSLFAPLLFCSAVNRAEYLTTISNHRILSLLFAARVSEDREMSRGRKTRRKTSPNRGSISHRSSSSSMAGGRGYRLDQIVLWQISLLQQRTQTRTYDIHRYCIIKCRDISLITLYIPVYIHNCDLSDFIKSALCDSL